MRSTRRLGPGIALLYSAAVAGLTSGCLTRTVRTDVFNQKYTEVFLRGEKRGRAPVDRGYDHPAVASPIRLLNILSRIDLRLDAKHGSRRQPAIPIETIAQISKGLSKALAAANSTQQAVVLSIRREKRFGIFDRKYLTSFVAYVKDDLLYIHLSRSEWEIPKRRREKLPEPHVGKQVMRFRVLPSSGMTTVNPQAIAVAWRSPIFERGSRVKTLPGGKQVRRTVVMETPEKRDDSKALPENLMPETLRKLADLEELRRGGDISEGEYNLRRNEILRTDPGTGEPTQ